MGSVRAAHVGGSDGDDFFDGCLALHDLVPAIGAHGGVTVAVGLGFEIGEGAGVGDEFLHFIGEEDDFVNGETAGEAGHTAFSAAIWRENFARDVGGDSEVDDVLWGDMAGCFAVWAEAADEALSEEGADGGGDEEGFDAHVDESGDATHGVVGMEGGEDEVTCEGGADGDFCGF